MNRVMLASALGMALLFMGACKAKTHDREAIRLGVVKHLSSMSGLNLPNMDINVKQYSVSGNAATAQVEITVKGGNPASGSMQLAYNLAKQGEEWVVVKTAPAGGTIQHPAPGEMPPGAGLPPGHPSGAGATGSVHPDFNEIMKGAQAPAPQPAAPATTAPQKP